MVLVAAVWTDHSSSGLVGCESLSFKVMFEVKNICLWQGMDQRQTVNIPSFALIKLKVKYPLQFVKILCQALIVLVGIDVSVFQQ